jgi:large subunit ribosomal protein L10
MAKTRTQKEAILSKTQDRLQRSKAVVLVKIKGIKVDQLENVRDSLFKEGLQLEVVKNSLFKQILIQEKLELPTELLDQPLGLIYSYEDQVAPARLANNFHKDIELLEIAGGLMDGVFLSASKVEVLAKLPSRDQLLGQLVGTLAAPLSGMVNVLNGNLRGLVQVLGQIRDQKA